MEFNGLKLIKTNFRFSSKKEMNEFFDNALIESPIKFLHLVDQRFLEKIHVNFSWMVLTKFLVLLALSPAIIGIFYHASRGFGFFWVGLSFGSLLISKKLCKRLFNLIKGREDFNLIHSNDMSYLEAIREELIQNKIMETEPKPAKL